MVRWDFKKSEQRLLASYFPDSKKVSWKEADEAHKRRRQARAGQGLLELAGKARYLEIKERNMFKTIEKDRLEVRSWRETQIPTS